MVIRYLTVIEANIANMLKEELTIYPEYVNKNKIFLLRNTGSTLIKARKGLVNPKDYTGEHSICRTLGGNQERYGIA